MSIRLYIGNLPEDITREDLEAVFNPEGGEVLFSAKLITDRKTGKCRGFGFVTVNTDEEADQFIEKFNGVTVKETTLKIEKALPRTKEKGEGEGEEGAVVAAPIPSTGAAATINKRGSGGNSGGNKGTGGGGNKGGGGRNNANRTANTNTNDSSDTFQPDPRWASVLEQLKEQLAAQATGT
jgi:RNA recognition motif-containing protein